MNGYKKASMSVKTLIFSSLIVVSEVILAMDRYTVPTNAELYAMSATAPTHLEMLAIARQGGATAENTSYEIAISSVPSAIELYKIILYSLMDASRDYKLTHERVRSQLEILRRIIARHRLEDDAYKLYFERPMGVDKTMLINRALGLKFKEGNVTGAEIENALAGLDLLDFLGGRAGVVTDALRQQVNALKAPGA